ncbi:type III restriction-modification system enzyme (StyLTI) modification methylase, partial [Salmonella enterica subsp. enterica serovar Enteritidis str. 6.0562-1]
MLKDNQKHNESVAPNSAFLSELQRALPEFFTADRYNEQGELIAKGGFDLARFERALKARNIDELTSGYQIDFIGKDYAKKQAGEKSVTVIVPDVEHNTLAENKNSHNLLYALGMGLPLMLVTVFGNRLLPKSGPWMAHVKTAFGFVILALPVFFTGADY